MNTATNIRERIIGFVERNPGCTLSSVQSEIRSEFGQSAKPHIDALIAEHVIKLRGSNLYMVED